MRETLTVAQLTQALLPRLKNDLTPPVWPPDMFALVMAVVARWGLYARGLESWPPANGEGPEWAARARRLGVAWRSKWIAEASKDPDAWWESDESLKAIRDKWNVFSSFGTMTRGSFASPENAHCAPAVLELAAIADEACRGFGIAFTQLAADNSEHYPESLQEFYYQAELRFIDTRELGVSLCWEIVPDRCRVLPKMHTPQSGLTIRSLSHNLAFLDSNEIKPDWYIPDRKLGKEHVNLLVVPAPSQVLPLDISAVEDPGPLNMGNMSKKRFGFFTYEPRPDYRDPLIEKVRDLIVVAERTIGTVHGIVFPELALTPEEFDRLSVDLIDQRPLKGKARIISRRNELDYGSRRFLIAGVRSEDEEPDAAGHFKGKNEVRFYYGRADDPSDFKSKITQAKHHRWKIDSSQIKQYGLGSRLDPEMSWWEHISVCDRRLIFLALQPWLVLSVLVCEDLARPDPVGDVLRAVGPNLVIALLMDGPQLKERWPARYATTLADDPGSSVLSITSIGMSALSRPQAGTTPKNRVIALWKASQASSPVEIELPREADAVVLSLTRRYGTEWTADGREDGGGAGYPELNGVHPISTKSIT